jgi:hypothetical protein
MAESVVESIPVEDELSRSLQAVVISPSRRSSTFPGSSKERYGDDETYYSGTTSSTSSLVSCPKCVRPPPRIHPESKSNAHTHYATLREQINSKLVGQFEDKPYAAVKVLLMTWDDQDLGETINEETNDLRSVFDGKYGFETERYKIPSKDPEVMLQKKISDAIADLTCLDVDKGAGIGKKLMIVYYNGHGTEDRLSGRLLWAA